MVYDLNRTDVHYLENEYFLELLSLGPLHMLTIHLNLALGKKTTLVDFIKDEIGKQPRKWWGGRNNIIMFNDGSGFELRGGDLYAVGIYRVSLDHRIRNDNSFINYILMERRGRHFDHPIDDIVDGVINDIEKTLKFFPLDWYSRNRTDDDIGVHGRNYAFSFLSRRTAINMWRNNGIENLSAVTFSRHDTGPLIIAFDDFCKSQLSELKQDPYTSQTIREYWGVMDAKCRELGPTYTLSQYAVAKTQFHRS